MGRGVRTVQGHDPDWVPSCETARSLMVPVVQPSMAKLASTDLTEFRNWSAEAQEKALRLIEQQDFNTWRPFYCPDINCDGMEHSPDSPWPTWQWRHGRADQRPPDFSLAWLVWLMQGGRGSGKTRGGAELTHRMTKKVPRIALVSPTGSDFRDTLVEGVSGILATSPPDKRPEYEPSKKRLTWPNGAIAQGFSGEEPDRLRGPQHGFAWLDEPAHMPLISDVWSNLLFGLRLGRSPRICCTTTPTPTKWMKELVADESTIVSRVSTYANLPNLADTYKKIISRYEGTRLGRQELHGEILEDVEGALWKYEMLQYVDGPTGYDRIVVAIDPAGSNNRKSDETGIVVLGILGEDLYLLADRSGKYSPAGWAKAAVDAYHEFSADAIVAEKNYGGDMVTHTLESTGARNIRIITVTSRRGKELRAEPIVALYEKERFFHVGPQGTFATLEDEQLSWVPGKGDSPNRVDALVHGATELAKLVMPSEIASPRDLMRHLQLVRRSA